MNLNIVSIGGNLTRDPDAKYLASGTAVCEFTVAINRKRKRADGHTAEETAFIGCTAFGKQAEVIAAHFSKGHRICIVGRLAQDAWDDKTTGEKRSKTKVIVENFHFVDRASNTKSKPLPPANDQAVTQTKNSQPENDDVPF